LNQNTGFSDRPRQGKIVSTRDSKSHEDPEYGDSFGGCGKEGNPMEVSMECIEGRKSTGHHNTKSEREREDER